MVRIEECRDVRQGWACTCEERDWLWIRQFDTLEDSSTYEFGMHSGRFTIGTDLSSRAELCASSVRRPEFNAKCVSVHGFGWQMAHGLISIPSAFWLSFSI